MSLCVVGRKLRVPNEPMVFVTSGRLELASRGRTSAEPVNRRSFTVVGEKSFVYCAFPL